MAYGTSVATANRKMIVKPAIMMFSAISFGVFCRSAPSTSAIMRSRNVSPGFDVILILMRSDRTRVPPVTALRSPPDSRITGALSPVMTDSSTVAMPSMTSPSPGMISPAAQTTTSPARSLVDDTFSICPFGSSRLAIVSVLVLRSDSACALPRASAIASANVGEQHGEPEPEVDLQLEADLAGAGRDVANEEQQHQHGADLDDEDHRVLHQRDGFSFSTDSLAACRRISGSNSGRARTSFFGISELSSTGDGGVGRRRWQGHA